MVVLAMVDLSGFDINIIKWIVLFMYTPVPILEGFRPVFSRSGDLPVAMHLRDDEG